MIAVPDLPMRMMADDAVSSRTVIVGRAKAEGKRVLVGLLDCDAAPEALLTLPAALDRHFAGPIQVTA
jgi:hypothetical protein